MKSNALKMLMSGLLLSACVPIVGPISGSVSGPVGNAVNAGSTQTGRQSLSNKQISGYMMRVAATFKVQAVNDLHAQLIQANVKDFENDLSQGQLDDYYQLPDFSIQLLAHSEGSYFTAPGNLSEFTNSNAAFARALVIYPDQSYDIFKGQFANQRFYFSGAESLPANNTSYLITLDKDLKTRVVTGQLEGQSQTATPTPAPAASPVILPTPEVLALPSISPSATPSVSPTASPVSPAATPAVASPPPAQRFASALEQNRLRAGGFNQQIRGFLPGPPPPPPPSARGQFAPPPGAPPLPNGQPPQGQPPMLLPPEIIERLRQERPGVLAEIEALAGLPPQEHYAAMLKIQAANADLIPALGPPPPSDAPPPSASGQP